MFFTVCFFRLLFKPILLARLSLSPITTLRQQLSTLGVHTLCHCLAGTASLSSGTPPSSAGRRQQTMANHARRRRQCRHYAFTTLFIDEVAHFSYLVTRCAHTVQAPDEHATFIVEPTTVAHNYYRITVAKD